MSAGLGRFAKELKRRRRIGERGRVFFDLVMIFGVAIVLQIILADLELFEWFAEFSRDHEDWELDEVFVTFVFMSFALTIFCIRRIQDQRRELALRQAAEQQSRIQARQDALTGLSNRRRLLEVLEGLPEEMEAGSQSALLILDLDGFKPINDMFGHQTGDEALQTVAQRLKIVDGPRLFVARLGGDEFAILVLHLARDEDPQRIAERIIAAIEVPFTAGGQEQRLEVSIGISVFSRDDANADQLRRADIALYRAKEDDHSAWHLYSEDTDRTVQSRALFEKRLRDALEHGRIVPHYQPIVDMRTGEVVKLEALARWIDDELGEVPPTRFIPVAEQRGLIASLTEKLLTKACMEAHSWPSAARLSVNISPVLLQNRTFALRILKILSVTGFPPHRLEIEVTENLLKQDVRTAAEVLSQLRSAGVRIALDDFGTGYSSLSRLRELPFDDLKIDQSFVHSMAANADSALIVETMLTLGRGLGMTIVAEGVEDTDQRDRLVAAGCTLGQGYLFSRAVPANRVAALFSAGDDTRERA